jgi:hypothetical protein
MISCLPAAPGVSQLSPAPAFVWARAHSEEIDSPSKAAIETDSLTGLFAITFPVFLVTAILSLAPSLRFFVSVIPCPSLLAKGGCALSSHND